MGNLEGRVALVTGAGQGVGRGISLALAKAGADVAIAEINPVTAASVATEIAEIGGRALAVECNVRRRTECEAAVDRVASELGSIDVLVNNALDSRNPGVPLVDATDDDMAAYWESCVMGTFWCMQAAHRHLRATGHGSVVNLGSAIGTEGKSGFAGYAAAKEGVRGLSRVGALEWAADGIRVNIVCPFANSPAMKQWSTSAPDLFAKALEANPMGRLGDCEEDIGQVVVFLASDASRYMTGHTFMVDGGMGMFR